MLIAEDGKQMGVVGIEQALRSAREAGLDLVEVSPNSSPPVCRIMDYSRYRYEREKRQKDARKHQRAGQLKEIRLRPKIGIHDFDVKLRKIEEFLKEGYKVKISVFFRGREKMYPDFGMRLFERVEESLGEGAVIERKPFKEGNHLSMLLVPKR